jgi:uncharacterized peroxidase-related enzyme
MPWITTIAPEEAEGRLAEAYAWQARSLGRPTEFTQLGSLEPELVHARLSIYRATFSVESQLTGRQRALILYLGSILNRTSHCSSLGIVQLRELTGGDDVIRALDEGRYEDLDAEEAAIARYTHKLTVAPGTIVEADVEGLRAVGFDDRTVLDINSHVAHINYTNRVANGLGLVTDQFVSAKQALSRVPGEEQRPVKAS